MSDAATQQIESVAAELGKLKLQMGSFGEAMGKKDAAERKLSGDLTKRTQATAGALTELMTSAEGAGQFFRSMLGNGLLGGTFRALIDIGSSMSKTYRVMNAHGQQFGGSMLAMSRAAAQAGIPLSEFEDTVKLNSMSMKRMGDKDFPALQRELRTTMMEASNFGMTMSGVTKFSADFWETTRTTGLLETMSRRQLIRQTYDLADVTQTMSAQTGKAAEAISELANSAIRDSLAASRIASMTSAQGIAANARLNQNISVLAAQAGEAGNFLSGLAAESFGMDDFAEFTTQGQTLIAAGMGQLAHAFDGVDQMSPEQTAQAMNDFRVEIGRNLPNLRDLAKSTGAGSAEARQLLRVYGEMQDVSISEMRQREKTKDGMTKFFLVIETLWNQVAGSFRDGFLKGFEPLFRQVGDVTRSDKFRWFATQMGKLGEAMGGVIAGLLSDDNLRNFGEKMGRFADAVGDYDWTGAMTAIWEFFRDINWSDVGSAIKSALDVLVIFGKMIGHLSPYLVAALLGFKMLAAPLSLLWRLGSGLVSMFRGLISGFGMLGRLLGIGGAAAAEGAAGAGAAAGGAGLAGIAAGAGLVVAGGAGAYGMYDGASRVNSEDNTDKALGYGESALGGAALGAAIGSVVPVVGTLLGGAIGGAIGLGVAGISDLWSDDAPAANESINESNAALERRAAAEQAASNRAERPDPSLDRLDALIAGQQIGNDLMVGVAQSQRDSANMQTRLLDKIAKKES